MKGHCLVAWDRVVSVDLVRLCLGGGFLVVRTLIKLVRVVVAAPRQVDALMPRCPSHQMGLEAAGGVHRVYPGRGVSGFSTPMGAVLSLSCLVSVRASWFLVQLKTWWEMVTDMFSSAGEVS